jgi:hypothetical protein
MVPTSPCAHRRHPSAFKRLQCGHPAAGSVIGIAAAEDCQDDRPGHVCSPHHPEGFYFLPLAFHAAIIAAWKRDGPAPKLVISSRLAGLDFL